MSLGQEPIEWLINDVCMLIRCIHFDLAFTAVTPCPLHYWPMLISHAIHDHQAMSQVRGEGLLMSDFLDVIQDHKHGLFSQDKMVSLLYRMHDYNCFCIHS